MRLKLRSEVKKSSSIINVRLSKEDHNFIKELATKQKLSLSDFIKTAINYYQYNGLPKTWGKVNEGKFFDLIEGNLTT